MLGAQPPRKSGGRRSRRKYPTKRRTSRKMTKKRILNITSRKKRDIMQQVTNMDSGTTVPGALGAREAFMNGNSTFMVPWIATARPALNVDGTPGAPVEEAVRTSKVCYMRGVKERISLRSADGAPWKWRRICFRLKGNTIYRQASAAQLITFFEENGARSGSMRPATNWNNTPALADEVKRVIFAGTYQVDWADQMLAPLDTNRISVAYDKTISLQAGNESGFIRTYNRWHGMNKNLNYDDDQDGTDMSLRQFSTEGSHGMGDYYIIDFFKSNGEAAAQLGLRYNATLYWHEK